MIITKTKFIEYTRCPRYCYLDKHNLKEDISYEEYKEEEILENLKELSIDSIYLDALNPHYKQVEIEAGLLVDKYFKGSTIYSHNTKNQKMYSFNSNKYKYLCYIDIFNKNGNSTNIIEVKATTSKKYMDLFKKDRNNIYILKDDIDIKKKNKLFNRYSDIGTYIYDLAVQRYFIEKELPDSNYSYYLAVLNSDYVFDGTYELNKAIYNKDKNDNEVIIFLDMTNITKDYQKIVEDDWKKLEDNLENNKDINYPLGNYCEYKKSKECQFFKEICGKNIPKSNSSLSYFNNGFGFIIDNKRIKGLELINNGYLNMLDIPEKSLVNKKHIIQRNCLKNEDIYINKEKIKAGLNNIKYPIYHLDFETFPSPLPRFKGEKPYMQSVFEFSLHIENEPGKCDKDKDNYIFLAKTIENDEREELIKKLIEYIDPNKGTILAQNVMFEKGRILELANIFPKYKDKLLKMANRTFDLLWLLNTNKELYEKLGFSKEESMLPNYYNNLLNGSYSIKKTLPIFSDLTYDDLDIHNGNEAIIAYVNYNNYENKEKVYNNLKKYCKQDTWAMVLILNKLRELIK